MNKFAFTYICISVLSLICLQAKETTQPKNQPSGTTSRSTIEQREVMINTLTWATSANAAGLGLDSYQQHGAAGFTVESEKGSLHRSQEGSGRNSLQFSADRYDQINNRFRVWGAFNFDMNRELERAYSDVFETYNRSPYIFGSDRPASYDTQLFDFTGKVAYLANERWNFGLGFNYLVGDMSRLRDPRSRSYLADYAIAPSATFRIDTKNSIGLYAKYRYRKEKMPSVKTYQEAPDYKYFFMMGLDNGEEPRLNADLESGMGMTRGWVGFRRQFMSNYWGGALQYQLDNNGWKWFTELDYLSESQNIWGDNQRSPGEYKSTAINVSSTLKSPAASLRGTVSLEGEIYRGQSNEFIQRLIETTNSETGISSKKWVTEFVYKNQYQVAINTIAIKGELLRVPYSGKGYLWKAGFMAAADQTVNTYNLPFSQLTYSFASAEVYGGVQLFNHIEHSLSVNANTGIRLPLGNTLALNAPHNALSQLILTPDMDYYRTTSASLAGNITYSFPINKRGKRSFGGYLKLYAHNTWAIAHSNNDWIGLSISLGIITL